MTLKKLLDEVKEVVQAGGAVVKELKVTVTEIVGEGGDYPSSPIVIDVPHEVEPPADLARVEDVEPVEVPKAVQPNRPDGMRTIECPCGEVYEIMVKAGAPVSCPSCCISIDLPVSWWCKECHAERTLVYGDGRPAQCSACSCDEFEGPTPAGKPVGWDDWDQEDPEVPTFKPKLKDHK